MRQPLIKLLGIGLVVLMLVSVMPTMLPENTKIGSSSGTPTQDVSDTLVPLDPEFNLTNDYQKIWEPNNIRGSSHAVATTSDGNYMASAGGYLNDREVHIFRWVPVLKMYYPIYDAGDSIIQGDVLDVAFMDADNDNRLEVVAGSADGHIYVFEQETEQDAPLNLVSPYYSWDLVWDSGNAIGRQVWTVMAFDIDHDSRPEIIAGSWDSKVHVFHFVDAQAWPYCLDENWFIFEHVWDSGNTITDRVNDIAVVDSDNDTLYEIVAGSQDGVVYLFEACACLKNNFNLMWTSGNTIYEPINSVAASQDLDTDKYGEIVVSAYGLGVYIFEYNGVTKDFDVRKINRDIMSWEKGISATTGVYTGYEADIYADRKVYGWETQGIYENDPIPAPYNTEYLGGDSALGGPIDGNATTFNSTEQFEFMREWLLEVGNGSGQFNLPYDIALAPDGTFYVSDFSNNRIVHLDRNMQFIEMWGEDGNETAQFNNPGGLTVDEDGYVYVADIFNSRVQKFTADGAFVASWGKNGSIEGQFFYAFDVAVREGILYVTDLGMNRVQALDSNTGEFLFSWGTPGTASGEFDTPSGIAVDSHGNVYVADDGNDRIQKFNSTGGFLLEWASNGPVFITIDGDDRVYVTDSGNYRVVKYSPSGVYESQFGTAGTGVGQFALLAGIAIYPNGGIVAMDPALRRIQLFGIQKYALLQALDLQSAPSGPLDFAIDSKGNYYVTSGLHDWIFKYASDGTYLMNWTVPNSGWTFGIEVSEADEVFVADPWNNIVLRYTTNGTLIGSYGSSGTGVGQLDGPVGLLITGDLLFVDEYNNDRISIFSLSNATAEIFATSGSGLGQVQAPYGLTMSSDGILYVADSGNARIERFYLNGTAIDAWSDPDFPYFLALDEDGYLYVTGGAYQTLKRYSPEGQLVDTFSGEFDNYTVRNGVATSFGIRYRAENRSLIIADNAHNTLLMVQPHLAMNNAAVAIVDFGRWEEITGDATSAPDFYIVAKTSLNVENVEFEISQDMKTFVTIDPTDYNYYIEGTVPPYGFVAFLGVNVDNTLRTARWSNFRYLMISVRGGVTYKIDAMWGRVDRPIANALAVRIGDIKYGSGPNNVKEIIIGTIDGEIMAYTSVGGKVWESQSDQPRFSLQTQIWDIVQVTGKGRIPTWLFDESVIQGSDLIGGIPSFNRFVSYSMVNIDGSSALDIVATVKEGAYTRLIYLRNVGTNAAPVYTWISNYFISQSTLSSDQILSYASVTMGDLDGDTDLDMLLGEAWYDVDTGWHYDIRYFEQTSPAYWTERPGYLDDMASIIAYNGFVPRVSLADVDYDGDLDITLIVRDYVLGVDQLYLYRQTGYSSGNQFYLLLDSTYYSTINADLKSGEVVGKIAFSDFDLDGDLDITVPHSTTNITYEGIDTTSSRMTYWENTGDRYNVEWTKHREMYEPDFTGTLLDPEHGYTGPEFHDMNGDGITDLVVLKQDSIDVFYGLLDHDTFIAATYPYLHMVEVDKRDQTYGYWGYNAYDSWTDSFKFETWSRSLEYGDVDQDGIPEVFVGSFDNNIIAFEQVANNTYRRSWRSPDFLLKSWLDNATYPIYENVYDMVIGDQDLDGKQEVIVTAGYNVYVFENIYNDLYELVWVSPSIAFAPYFDPGKPVQPVPQIPTALAVDKDLDNDGKPEIIVGAESYLVVFEMVGDNNYSLVAYYQLSPLDIGTSNIQAVMTDDVDRDGFRDIVLVGYDEQTINGQLVPLVGWVRFYENNKTAGGTHQNDTYVQRFRTSLQGPGYAVDIADNDLDGMPEVFAGFDGGVEIFESSADNSLTYQNYLPTAETVRAVMAGNTDGDSWLEVVVGTGKNLTVFEQNATYDRKFHIYDEVWNSGELAEDITDIRIGDSNRNGRLEIIATALKGYLYDFEWSANTTSEAPAPFLLSTGLDSVLADSNNGLSSAFAADVGPWSFIRESERWLRIIGRETAI